MAEVGLTSGSYYTSWDPTFSLSYQQDPHCFTQTPGACLRQSIVEKPYPEQSTQTLFSLAHSWPLIFLGLQHELLLPAFLSVME